MAAHEGIRLGSSRGTALRNIIRLIPAVVVIAATLNTVSCNGNTIFPQVHGGGGGGSKSPTATATAGTGSLAFVTNFNDGKVSSFTRNISTGALTLTNPQVKAGAKNGPRGVVASPNGNFLYVANIMDNNIYEFSVNQTTGALTPLSTASVSNGNGSGPDELAINSAGTLLWVTGAHNGTVTAYTVNSSTGQLTRKSSIGGFNTPFGIAVHPTLAVIYVSDLGTGLIQPMSYNTKTGALAKNFTAVGSSDPLAVLPAAITIDALGDALFVPDEGTGEVSPFAINTSTGALTQGTAQPNISVTAAPLGIGIGTNASVEYVFTANFGGNSVSSFIITFSTTVNSPPTVASGYNAPKGLVVDPQNAFVYAADSGNGMVSQSIIKGACGSSICAGPTVPTESPANTSSGPFGITLAP
jgi:6-phosphogluconolactonase (cycloisomerase 2 family)